MAIPESAGELEKIVSRRVRNVQQTLNKLFCIPAKLGKK